MESMSSHTRHELIPSILLLTLRYKIYHSSSKSYVVLKLLDRKAYLEDCVVQSHNSSLLQFKS